MLRRRAGQPDNGKYDNHANGSRGNNHRRADRRSHDCRRCTGGHRLRLGDNHRSGDHRHDNNRVDNIHIVVDNIIYYNVHSDLDCAADHTSDHTADNAAPADPADLRADHRTAAVALLSGSGL